MRHGGSGRLRTSAPPCTFGACQALWHVRLGLGGSQGVPCYFPKYALFPGIPGGRRGLAGSQRTQQQTPMRTITRGRPASG
ncbi:hypothetical protein VZT92_014485 [Zoarces viviparus]|uniref:Uncharacterized protein n=1 Tax=Zoarces viviparus TaxID=48416 RepID=A0AAW1F2V2_ZOAVI